jgi:hypothetical protein
MELIVFGQLLIEDSLQIVPNKSNAATIAEALQNKVFDDGVSPFTICERLSFFKEIEERFKSKKMIDHIRAEASKYGKEGASTSSGTAIKLYDRSTFDYSHDPVWQSLEKQIKDLTEKRKAREEFLKHLPDPSVLNGKKPLEEVDPETGEMFEVWPAKKIPTVETFSVTLQK